MRENNLPQVTENFTASGRRLSGQTAREPRSWPAVMMLLIVEWSCDKTPTWGKDGDEAGRF